MPKSKVEQKLPLELLRAIYLSARRGDFKEVLKRFNAFTEEELRKGIERLVEDHLKAFYPEVKLSAEKSKAKPSSKVSAADEYERLILFTDGGSRGNPGPAAAGAALKTPQGKPLAKESAFLGSVTNNVAEYEALCLGLSMAADYKPKLLEVKMDSELIIKQMNGKYRVKDPVLRELHEKAKLLVQRLKSVKFDYIPREQNAEADALVNECLDKYAL